MTDDNDGNDAEEGRPPTDDELRELGINPTENRARRENPRPLPDILRSDDQPHNDEDRGLESIWPDDPRDRVRAAISPVISSVTTATVAEWCDISEGVARRELAGMADQGWVERTGRDEWRVDLNALDADGLFPDE